MATTTRKSTTTTKAPSAKTATAVTKKTEVAVSEQVVPKEIDQNEIIIVKNGFQGKLVYVSPRTGERYVWESFGDEQELELRELRNIKSSAKAFYENNWFMFDEEHAWVIDYLGLSKYYENCVSIEDFDDVFSKTAEEIEAMINKMSNGQKQSVGYRARQLIASKEIDSIRTIEALEKALGIELIER